MVSISECFLHSFRTECNWSCSIAMFKTRSLGLENFVFFKLITLLSLFSVSHSFTLRGQWHPSNNNENEQHRRRRQKQKQLMRIPYNPTCIPSDVQKLLCSWLGSLYNCPKVDLILSIIIHVLLPSVLKTMIIMIMRVTVRTCPSLFICQARVKNLLYGMSEWINKFFSNNSARYKKRKYFSASLSSYLIMSTNITIPYCYEQ